MFYIFGIHFKGNMTQWIGSLLHLLRLMLHVLYCINICSHKCMHASMKHVYMLMLTTPTIFVLISPSGYARLSNVEFLHSGQEGFVSSFDARYSVTFFDIGKISITRPSYVTKCAFHNGFSPSFGVVGTHDLELVNNVIHHTVGPGEEYVIKACVYVGGCGWVGVCGCVFENII